MSDVRFVNLYSGSSGNCTFVRTPDVSLIFDAGRSAAYLKKSLLAIGDSIENINAIFIKPFYLMVARQMVTYLAHNLKRGPPIGFI